MTLLLHDLEAPGSVHVPHDLEYPNASDRVAGTNEVFGHTLESRHIGRVARQNDNWTFWVLRNYDPILWVPFSAQGFATTEDAEIYINSTTGSDDTGDGSIAAPFASFGRAFLDYPAGMRIRHKIKIKPAAGDYSELPILDYFYEENGGIIVDASGETYPVEAGPFTVSTVTPIGNPGPWGAPPLATDLQVSGSPGWSVDAYKDKFIHILTGNWAGYVLPIWKNDGDTIRLQRDVYTFVNGDTFNIVDCPVNVNATNIMYLGGSGKNLRTIGLRFDFLFSGVCFNLDVGARGPTSFKDAIAIFSFCKFVDKWDGDDFSRVLSLGNVDLNNFPLAGSLLDNDKLEDWYAYALHLISRDGAAPATPYGLDISASGGSSISQVCCRRPISVAGGVNKTVGKVLCGGISTSGNSSYSLDTVFIEQIGFTTDGIIVFLSDIRIDAVHIAASGLPLRMFENNYVGASWFQGVTSAAYALELDQNGYFYITSAANVTILGTSGAVKFVFDGSTHAAWPTTGNSHTDPAGNRVVTK